ncbi:MAG: hypothetical protein ACR2NV_03220 [Thermoleophilaceae bacterium]
MAEVSLKGRGRGRIAGALAAGLLLTLLVAVGGYLLGHSSGVDVDAARVAGVEEGRDLARSAADRRGYQEGRRVGESRGRRATYRKAYKSAYRGKARELMRQESRRAAAAQEAGAGDSSEGSPSSSRETEELPNGRPGYALPEEQRTLGCVGTDAETGECVGD